MSLKRTTQMILFLSTTHERGYIVGINKKIPQGSSIVRSCEQPLLSMLSSLDCDAIRNCLELAPRGICATGVVRWPEITWEKVSKIGYRSHCFGAEESYKATLRGKLRRWSYPRMGRAVCDIDCEHRLTVARKKATDILSSMENEGYAV